MYCNFPEMSDECRMCISVCVYRNVKVMCCEMKWDAHLWLCSARRCCGFRSCVVREMCALREDVARQTQLPLANGLIYSCASLLAAVRRLYSVSISSIRHLYLRAPQQFDPLNTDRKYFSVKRISFSKFPTLRPFVILVRAACRWRRVSGVGGMELARENRNTWRTPVSVSLWPQQHWHGLTWDRTRGLTAWAMVQTVSSDN